MKHILLLSFLFISLYGSAQNYNCFVPGAYQYFIPANNPPANYHFDVFGPDGGYLRGMHIDSVKQDSNTRVYYPFHTLRGSWNFPGMMPQSPPLDTNGGSWLGKAVIQRPDGTFLFKNYWGDTVIIKTQANVGDTWTFYNDATTSYYNATVMSLDTMSILGVIDSIKTIKISAINDSLINATDQYNDINIILSKNHGFAQVFDLYIFPMHDTDTLYIPENFDFFTDQANALVFKQVKFHNPTISELNNHEIGDILEGTVQEFVDLIYLDTIVGKIVYPDSVKYTFHSGLKFPPTYLGGLPTVNFVTESLIVPNLPYFDSTLMPESIKYSNYAYYYYPDDTTWCYKSNAYILAPTYISNNYYFEPPIEACSPIAYLKAGFGDQPYHGMIRQYVCNNEVALEDQLYFSYKSGNGGCGTYQSILSVPITLKSTQFNVYPDPAFEQVNVKNTDGSTYNLSVINSVGQQLYIKPNCKNTEVIDVKSFTSGMYIVIINDDYGHVEYKKIVVQH